MAESIIDAAFADDESRQLERYQRLAQISSDWFWETDENFIVIYMSESVKRITGYPPEKYVGVSRFDLVSDETKQTSEWKHHVQQVARREPIKNFEYKHVGTDNKVSYLRVNAIPLFGNGGKFKGYLGTTADITELIAARKRVEEINSKLVRRTSELEAAKWAAEQLSQTDALTGLTNRMKLDRVLLAEVNRTKRYNRALSIILMDIDHFKMVNDKLGHQMGDKVLQGVAATLRDNVRKVDIVGRWGGEEFMVICPETHGDDAWMIAEKLRGKLESWDLTRECVATGSFGVAELGADEDDADLVRKADKALYEAKSKGRNRVEMAG